MAGENGGEREGKRRDGGRRRPAHTYGARETAQEITAHFRSGQ